MSSRCTDSFEGKILFGKWRILKKVGSGGFGTVYRVENVRVPTELAAAKLEESVSGHRSALLTEIQFYQQLDSGVVGFPKCIGYGENEERTHKVILITLLGPSLLTLFKRYEKSFLRKTVLMIAIQGLDRIEALHHMGYVHRDIKPANMLIGLSDRDVIYFADFGLVKKFKTSGNTHISNDGYGHRFVGTRAYASVNVHKGRRVTRRDDLISFGYSLIKLSKGLLPWSGDSLNVTIDRKIHTPRRYLCEFCPDSFIHYMKYVEELRFAEKPDYDFLRGLFRDSLKRRGHSEDNDFDWIRFSA